MKIFITGGTGCIGQYVTALSSKKGHETLVLSRNPENYKPFSEMENVTLVKGNMTDYDLMQEYVKGCDAVIHIALGWGDTPVQMLMNDTLPTAHLLEISEKAGVNKFIYTSSVAAYGNCLPGIDEAFPCSPLDLYGGTKAACEAYVIGFRKYFGAGGYGSDSGGIEMKRNVIRPSYTFANPIYPGATVQKDMSFRNITDKIVKGQPIHSIKHSGLQFLSAEQLADVYMAFVESDLNEEVFNAVAKNFITWEEVARMALEEYPESKSEIVAEDKGWSSTPTMYSFEKVKRVFGLEFDSTDEVRGHVKFSIEESLKLL